MKLPHIQVTVYYFYFMLFAYNSNLDKWCLVNEIAIQYFNISSLVVSWP